MKVSLTLLNMKFIWSRSVECDYRRGFVLVNGFTDHLYTRLGTTSSYSATANHNSQITTAPAKLFQPAVSLPAVPWQRLLTVEILQLHALKSSLQRLAYRTGLVAQLSSRQLLCTDHAETLRFQQYLYCCASIRCCGNVFTEPLPRNGSGIFAYLAVVA
jgi:hypothetical protein